MQRPARRRLAWHEAPSRCVADCQSKSAHRSGTMPRHEGGVSPREMPMTEHIKLWQDGGVLEIIFARPEKKNALSNAMYRAVTEALERAHNDPAIRVVLFGAEGDAFTAGNDIADLGTAAAGPVHGRAA